eukprot:3931599-Rhodomonas_salina.1
MALSCGTHTAHGTQPRYSHSVWNSATVLTLTDGTKLRYSQTRMVLSHSTHVAYGATRWPRTRSGKRCSIR